jgi:hypothetical protein
MIKFPGLGYIVYENVVVLATGEIELSLPVYTRVIAFVYFFGAAIIFSGDRNAGFPVQLSFGGIKGNSWIKNHQNPVPKQLRFDAKLTDHA